MKDWGNEAGGGIFIALASPPILSLPPEVFTIFRKRYPKVQLQLMEATLPHAEPCCATAVSIFKSAPCWKPRCIAVARGRCYKNRRMVFARADHPLGNATSLKQLLDAQWLYGGLQLRAKQDLEDSSSYKDWPHRRI